jgi:putative ABC transport system permease protein
MTAAPTGEPGRRHLRLTRLASEPPPVFFAMREAVGLGLSAIRAYKMRAGLTILGVVMGIMTVTGMSAIVAGLNRSMASQIEGLGSSVIFIRFFRPGENVTSEEWRRRKLLNLDEVRAIQERCPAVKAVAPAEFIPAFNVKYRGDKLQDNHTFGVTAAYEEVHDSYVERGRFLSDADVSRSAPVAVIGVEVVEALFPSIDPLGKELLIEGRPFTVVGVLEKRGKFLGHSMDNTIFVPLGSFKPHAASEHYLFTDLKPVSAALIDDAIEQAREVLRHKRRLRFWQSDNFGIFTQNTLLDLYRKITGGIYLVMIAISSIGLVVGGVGVMNIMLVSVTERTREIGVRKALGATRGDVRWQFLTEAMTVTGVGGIIGVLVGALVAWLVNALSPFPAAIQPFWVVLAFVTSVVVGLVFGLWPAAKAARLDPVEALRYE